MRFINITVLILLFTVNIHLRGNLKVLIITGGHSYDTLAFHTVFGQMEGLLVENSLQPAANELIASGEASKYDVIVFYDMWQNITDKEKKGYESLLRKGTGMVFLHHSLVSYQTWDRFTEVIGGKYRQSQYYSDSSLFSDYKYNISMKVICNPEHPITKDFGNFEIFDEGYSNLLVLPDVDVLMTTDHEDCHDIIGWAHEVSNSRVVYLLPGHGVPTYTHPVYQQIIRNAILWTAGNL